MLQGILEVESSTEIWFNLSIAARQHLFFPTKQAKFFGKAYLLSDSTKEEVAQNIFDFIKTCKADSEIEKIATRKTN